MKFIFEKPVRRHSNCKQWKVYVVSISLQLCAFFITLFTKREITHGFYFSQKQHERHTGMLLCYCSNPQSPTKRIATFHGKSYTEMRKLKYGWINWADSKLIGLGSMSDIRFINPNN